MSPDETISVAAHVLAAMTEDVLLSVVAGTATVEQATPVLDTLRSVSIALADLTQRARADPEAYAKYAHTGETQSAAGD